MFPRYLVVGCFYQAPSVRKVVLTVLEGLMAADGGSSPEELQFLKQFSSILEEGLPGSSLMAQMQGLFKKTVFKPVQGSKRSEELHDFLNNRILFKVRRKLEREKLSLETHPNELAYASLFGGLLACVASLHKPMDDHALGTLRSHLKTLEGFDEESLELVCSVVQETASKGLDRFRLSREFYGKSSLEQRFHLVDCLFDIAGSDTDLDHSEVEEVRAIAYGLKLSHRDFIKAKKKHLQKPAVS